MNRMTAKEFWYILWGDEAYPLEQWNGEDCPMTPSRFREALDRINGVSRDAPSSRHEQTGGQNERHG